MFNNNMVIKKNSKKMEKRKKTALIEARQSTKRSRVNIYLVGILAIFLVGILSASWFDNAVRYTGFENGLVNGTGSTGITWDWSLSGGYTSTQGGYIVTSPTLNGTYALKLNASGTNVGGVLNDTGFVGSALTNNTIAFWINDSKPSGVKAGYVELYSAVGRSGNYNAYTLSQWADCTAGRICSFDGSTWSQSAYNYTPNTWARMIITVNSSGTWFFFNNQSGFVRKTSSTSLGTFIIGSNTGYIDNFAVCTGQDFMCGIYPDAITVALDSPSTATNQKNNIVFTSTITPSSFPLASGTLDIWYSNGTLLSSTPNTTFVGNTTTFNISSIPIADGYIWNVYGCQGDASASNCSFSSTNSTFSVKKVLFADQSYASSILEQSSATFKINFTLSNGYSLSSVNFTYNGTNYSASTSAINSSWYQATRILTTPSVSADTNVTFNFSAVLTDGSSSISNNTIQTIVNFGLDDCSVNTIQILNMTLLDEETQGSLNATADNTSIKINLLLYPDGTLATPVFNYSHFYNKTLPARVCVSDALGSSEFFMNSQIQYGASGYASEFYNIQNYSLNATSNPSMNLSLYDLLNSSNQVFKITYKDSNYLPVENALIQISRTYIDSGISKTVEVPITDSQGVTVANLQLNTVIYTFTVTKYGEVLSVFSNYIAQCQNPLIETCEINLNAFQSSIPVTNYTQGEDFLYTLTYNNNTRTISSSFTIPSGAVSTVSLNVTKTDAIGTSVCNQSISTSSGTLNCAVPSSFGNTTVMAYLYKDGSLVAYGQINLQQTPQQIYGGGLVLFGLFIMLTLIGASISDNPIVMVVSFLVGFFLLMALNLVSHNGFIGGTATVLFLIIAIIIVLIKASKRS